MFGCGKGSQRNPRRQRPAGIWLSLPLLLALAGCAGKPDESLRGTVGFVQGFLGGVVADEPRAALVGREILSQGGSAADAAAATYFALAVTSPSSATLGGGGVCLVHDPAKDKDKAVMLDFVVPAAKPAAGSAGANAAAVPMNARGFFVLHSRYGRLKWERLAAPAANLARFGVPLSRALARDLARTGAALGRDAEARRIFGRPDSAAPLGEGERLIQVDLAAMLDRIRNQGPGDLHVGAGARDLAEAYRTAGFALDRDALRDAVPVWRDPVAVPIEGRGRRMLAHFTVPPADAGSVAGRIVAGLAEKERYVRGGANERAALFVDAARQAGSASPPVAAEVSATASFVVADRDGQVVACAVTPNRVFGAGRVAPGTGILIAAPAALGTLAATIVNDRRGEGTVFAAASGGAASAAAMAQILAATLFEGRLLEDALAQARLLPAGPPRGMEAGGAPHEATVNALACPGGLREKPHSCSLRADPRGLGLAAMAD